MNKDTVIGIGLGLVIGWLLWRRRQMALTAAAGAGAGGAMFGAGAGAGSGGGCGCSRPCAQAVTGGLGNFAQSSGPVAIPQF
jgi:hypothetical protein